MHKFRLELSITKELVGYEYLTVDGWKNDVFDYGEREGVFDQRELGDGFLGIVTRKVFVTTDTFDKEIFEGDIIAYQLKRGHYSKGAIKYDKDRCSFVILINNYLERELPLKSECNIFSLVVW